MHHYCDADCACADAPAVLVHVFAHAALILEQNLEHLREDRAEINLVARRALTAAFAAWNVHLHCRRHIGARELLVLRLAPARHRNREQLLEHSRVEIQNLVHLRKTASD